MIGLERNGDIVRLASYAPLLARIGGTQWIPDLLYFDETRVLRTANYHVQAMFAASAGAGAHRVVVTGAEDQPVERVEPRQASIRAVDSRVVATDIRVNGEPRAQLVAEATGEPVSFAATASPDLVLELTLERTAGHYGVVIAIGGQTDADPRVEVVLGSWDNRSSVVVRQDEGLGSDLGAPLAWSGFVTGVPLAVRIELVGTRVRVWLDDSIRHDSELDLRPEARVVVGAVSRPADAASGAIEQIVRIVNATDVERDAVITGRQWTHASAITLAGAEPDDGAPFRASPVVPVVLPATIAGDSVRVRVAPWSFTVATLG